MKKKLGFTLSALALSAVMCFGVACGGGGTKGPDKEPDNKPPVTNPDDPTPDEKFTVKFDDGLGTPDSVKEFTDLKAGDEVTVPDAPTREDERYTFTGWEGKNPGDKVTVYGDKTYTASWNEMFGSKTVFNAVQRDLLTRITVDGKADDQAWEAAEQIDFAKGEGSYAKMLWDSENLYLFVNVAKENVTSADKLKIEVDLLHSLKYASPGWSGSGWGGDYRNNGPDVMVEGGYTITAQTAEVEKTWEWLSAGGWDKSDVKTTTSNDGYTVEFKLDLTNASIGEFKPQLDQEIGISITTTDGAAALEAFDGYASRGPKTCSNVKLVANDASEIKTTWDIKEVRELYDVEVDDKEDVVYKDAKDATLDDDDYSVKALWKEGKIYFLAELSEKIGSLAITAFDTTVTFNKSGEQALEASGVALDGVSYFTVKVDGETVVGEDNSALIQLKANDKNFGRHQYEAKQLAEDAKIVVDGDLDEAYGEYVADVNVPFQLSPKATGKVYIRWDNEYLYVFVEVTDSSVCAERHSDTYHCDSVELSIDTCQTHTFDTSMDMGYGSANRPEEGYEGEGHFRMNAFGEYSWQGFIWMGDDSQNVFGGVECATREEAIASGYGYTNKDGKEWSLEGTAAKVTETGYNVEYRMAWKSFGEKYETAKDKIGQVIGFMVNINDANDHKGGDRDGVMSLNSKGGESWQCSGVLEQLKLVAAGETTAD